MFSRKKKPAPAKVSSRQRGPVDFVIPGIPGFDPTIQEDDDELEKELLALTGGKVKKATNIGIDSGDDDDDLEAELARILGNTSGNKKKKPVKTVPLVQSAKYVDPLADIDGAASSDDDIDENDPSLLHELSILTGDGEEDFSEDTKEGEAEEVEKEDSDDEEVIPSQLETIKERLHVYKEAESKAKISNESARARRFNRGVKTLEKLLKRAETGEVIPNDEIPPPVALSASTQQTSSPIQPISNTEPIKQDNEKSEDVTELPEVTPFLPTSSAEYVPESNTQDKAFTGENISNAHFQTVPVIPMKKPSLEPLPSTPTTNNVNPVMQRLLTRSVEYKKAALSAKNDGNKVAALEHVRTVKAIDKLISMVKNGENVTEDQIPSPPSVVNKANLPIKSTPQPLNSKQGLAWMGTEIFSVPKTVAEALNQRLNYYIKAVKTAEMKGLRVEATKCREIVKVYQNAVLHHKKGAHFPFEKLPTPPGCPPIPISFRI